MRIPVFYFYLAIRILKPYGSSLVLVLHTCGLIYCREMRPLRITFSLLGCRIGIIRLRSPFLVQKGGGGGHSETHKNSESNVKQFGTSIPYVSWHQHCPRCMAVSGGEREGTGPVLVPAIKGLQI